MSEVHFRDHLGKKGLKRRQKRAQIIESHDIDIPDGDLELGRKIYHSSCTGCHNLDSDGGLGPSLKTVYGRRVASRKGYGIYSRAMGGNRFYWTRENLFKFLENPEEFIPETGMFFDGISDPFERASVIEYLMYLKEYT